MSYGPAGYEDDWDDDEFDFGDYSSDNFYKTSVHSKHMDEAPSKSSVTSQFASNKPKVHGTLGSQTSSTTTSKVPFGRGRGRGRGRGGFSTPQNRTNSSYSTEKNGKKQNGQGNLMLTSTGDKTRKNNMVELKNYETAESLRAAILKGDVAVVENILHQGMSADYVLKTGWTGLMHAANCGQLGVLMALTNQGANVNFHKDKFTVLMAACSSDCNAEDDLVLCVNHLIEKGAKINCHDRYLMTPLMYACRNGLVKVVEVLLHHKPDVNKQDQRGWTALSWAASRGHGKIVRILLDENANPKQYTNDGQSAEDLAYDGGFTIIADVLHAAANPTRELRQNVSITKRDSLPNTEKGECTKYGDLELFLFGLELGHLVPLFQGLKMRGQIIRKSGPYRRSVLHCGADNRALDRYKISVAQTCRREKSEGKETGVSLLQVIVNVDIPGPTSNLPQFPPVN